MATSTKTEEAEEEIEASSPEHVIRAYRARTDRLKVLVDFLQRPVCCNDQEDMDPDVLAAYNATIEHTLKHIRTLAGING